MLRVIIADDEERICRLIQTLADWQRLGMTVAGTAGNGLEALALIQRLEPDILITDIRMPGCGGLELISRAKEIAPALEVIIISGYAQFDYAQTAIQYGVGEYLLKPVNKEALNNTLAKMGQRCEARQKETLAIENLRLDSQDERVRRRDGLIPDLLEGRFSAQDAAGGDLFGGKNDIYQAFLLKLDYDMDQFQEPSLDIVRHKAEDVFRPLLAELCGDLLLGGKGAVVCGVVNYPADAREWLRGRLREGLNQLVAQTSLFGPVVFSLALGQPVRQADELTDSLDSARRAIVERLTEGTGRLLEGTPAPSAFQEAPALARYVQEATHAIDVLSLEEARNAALALEGMTTEVPDIRGGELLNLVQGAGLVFATRLGVPDREQVLAEFGHRCGQCATVRQLFDSLQKLQRDLLSAALEQRRNQDAQPIRLAKQYIQKHFSQPLTLEEVSEAIGLSVNYFSTLFKRETGEGFNKYLTRIRMEEARGLLRETRLPVAEICKRVGYMDIKHFTHTFKAVTGLTPGEFRKLYG